MSDDAGALLVRAGLIEDDDLRLARQRRIEEGGTLGEHLVLSGFIGDEELTQFFRTRLMVPQVNPNHLARLSPSVIAKLPPDMATEFRTVPVSVDRDGNLMLAMSDPSDSHAVDEIAFFTGHYVVRAVATQMQIAWCLAHYYGCISPLGARLLKPKEGERAAVPAPRSRSLSGQISAERRRVMPPVSAEPDDLPPPGRPLAKSTPGLPAAARDAVAADGGQDDEGGQVLEIEADSPSGAYRIGDDTNPTGEIAIIAGTMSPPELAARHGELLVRGGGARPSSELPAVMVDITGAIIDPAGTPTDEIAAIDDETPVVAHTAVGTESRPIMLSQPKVEPATPRMASARLPLQPGNDEEAAPASAKALGEDTTSRRAAAPAADAHPEPSEVIVLSSPKVTPAPPKRRSRSTRVGMGFDNAAKPRSPTAPPSRPGLPAVPSPRSFEDDGDSDGDGEPPTWVDDGPTEGVPQEVPHDESGGATGQFLSLGEPPGGPDDLDDGWGPPGSTIPPPFLGALPGTGPQEVTGEVQLPIAYADTQVQRSAAVARHDEDESGPISFDDDATGLADASAKLVDTLRAIDRARSRDALIDVLLAYLASARRRIAFLAVKAGQASLWKASPVPITEPAPMNLQTPSTLRDVVATRLPFRGPVQDAPTREFLGPLLGDGEILLVPISVRERVVGVLGGGVRSGKVFDEHLAVLARAAGTALERILKSRRVG